MKRLRSLGLIAVVVGTVLMLCRVPSRADSWQFSATPYLWLPTINGHLSYQTPNLPGSAGNINCIPLCTVDFSITPNQLLPKLNSAIMLAADVRKGRWDLATDIINMNLTVNTSATVTFTGPFGHITVPFNINTSTRSTGTIWTLEGGYSLFQNKMFNVDFIGGFRSTALTARSTYDLGGAFGRFARSGSLSQNAGPFDWIVGVKGRANLTNKLFIPYYLDVGAGTNSSTAQELIGVGYGHNASLELVYRNIAYTSTNTALKSMNLAGPALGYTFHF